MCVPYPPLSVVSLHTPIPVQLDKWLLISQFNLSFPKKTCGFLPPPSFLTSLPLGHGLTQMELEVLANIQSSHRNLACEHSSMKLEMRIDFYFEHFSGFWIPELPNMVLESVVYTGFEVHNLTESKFCLLNRYWAVLWEEISFLQTLFFSTPQVHGDADLKL